MTEHGLITADQRTKLLLACEELIGSGLMKELRGRLRRSDSHIGDDLELVTLFAGLTVGEARPHGSNSWDMTWTLVSGTEMCVEATHIHPEKNPRPLPELEFRRRVEEELLSHGVHRPWNINLVVIGSNAAPPKLGKKEGWNKYFDTPEFRRFMLRLLRSNHQTTQWIGPEDRFVVRAAGAQSHPTKEPLELPLWPQSHALYGTIKEKARQLRGFQTGKKPALVVVSATDGVDHFSRFPMFRGDPAGPCRWALGAVGTGDFVVRDRKLVRRRLFHSGKISVVKLVLPWRPHRLDFSHRVESLVPNESAEFPLNATDRLLVNSASFITWRNGPLPAARQLAFMARNHRDALRFNILPPDVRREAVGAVYFGDDHDHEEKTLHAVALAQDLKSLGASPSFPEYYLRTYASGETSAEGRKAPHDESR